MLFTLATSIVYRLILVTKRTTLPSSIILMQYRLILLQAIFDARRQNLYADGSLHVDFSNRLVVCFRSCAQLNIKQLLEAIDKSDRNYRKC